MKLLEFQELAVKEMVQRIFEYNPSRNPAYGLKSLGIEDEEPLPYLHRLKAVTGAGKTPMLATLANQLGDAIIFWTTPRSAVISQTLAGLSGKYRDMLPADVSIYDMSKMSDAEWDHALEAEKGLSILAATVASFNQEGDKLNLHKGSPSRWQQLKPSVKGGIRKRRLFVFYDEGHNTTSNQFAKLLELRPYGFVLASASQLPEDLLLLIPGGTKEIKAEYLNNKRTTVISTKEVVAKGLLKRGMKLYDCALPWQEILKGAKEKHDYLQTLVKGQSPIACYVVSRTDEGLEVWEQLKKLRVPGHKIAVHLSKAGEAAKAKWKKIPADFADTYTKQLSPEEIRRQGFTHLIWNISLREGWDEPWAYVAYIHDVVNHSITDAEQKIGRFVRNPFKDAEGMPQSPEEPDLDQAYFYFNCKNNLFSQLLVNLKESFNTEGFDAIIEKRIRDQGSEEVPVKKSKSIPRLFIWPELQKIRKAFLDSITLPHPDECRASGVIIEGLFDLLESTTSETTQTLGQNFQVTSGEIIRSAMQLKDRRIVKGKGSEGGWLDHAVWQEKKMLYPVCYTSRGHKSLEEQAEKFCETIDRHLTLDTADGEEYVVAPFKMNRPGFKGDKERITEFYKVRGFKNSLHKTYNSLNPFEVLIASCIDKTGLEWVRNPAKVGYGIPLVKPTSTSNVTFFPDFIAWVKKEVWFIEPKGKHLTEAALAEKLLDLPKGFQVLIIEEPNEDPGVDGPTTIYTYKNRKVQETKVASCEEGLKQFLC